MKTDAQVAIGLLPIYPAAPGKLQSRKYVCFADGRTLQIA